MEKVLEDFAKKSYEWINQNDRQTTLDEIFENYSCDYCGTNFNGHNVVYTGQPFGLPEFTICEKCYQNPITDYNINDIQCDWRIYGLQCHAKEADGFYQWKEKNEYLCLSHGDCIMDDPDPEQTEWKTKFVKIPTNTESDIVHLCDSYKWKMFACKLNPTKGWWINLEKNHDLCIEHMNLFQQTSSPEVALFTKNSTANLAPIYSHDKFYRCDDREAVIMVPPNLIDLALPDLIETWFKYWPSTMWDSIVSVNNSHTSSFGTLIVNQIQPTEWMPHEIPEKTYLSDWICALINVNPKSSLFGQMATMVMDDHGRIAFNFAHINHLEYQIQYQKWLNDNNSCKTNTNTNDSDDNSDDENNENGAANFPEYLRAIKKQGFYYG